MSKIKKKYKVILSGDIPPSFKEFELLNLEFDFLPAIGDWVTIYFGDDGYFYFKVEGRQFFQQKELREDILHQTSVALYFGKNVFIHSYCTESLGSGLKEGELTSSEKSINRFLKEYGIERDLS